MKHRLIEFLVGELGFTAVVFGSSYSNGRRLGAQPPNVSTIYSSLPVHQFGAFHMRATKAFAAQRAHDALTPFSFDRREPGPHDVVIEISHCGVCHTDWHFVNNDFGMSLYPMVPGHEIVGRVTRVGSEVRRFAVGDGAGVGCLVDSCRQCDSCEQGLEQHCENGFTLTYSGLERDGTTVTQGGYSTSIVVDERFVLRVPETLAAERGLRCCAPASLPTRRYDAGRSGPATSSRWSGWAVSDTWP